MESCHHSGSFQYQSLDNLFSQTIFSQEPKTPAIKSGKPDFLPFAFPRHVGGSPVKRWNVCEGFLLHSLTSQFSLGSPHFDLYRAREVSLNASHSVQWTSMLDLLEGPLQSGGFQYRRLDGTMTVQARDRAINDFTKRPEVRPFGSSTSD